MNKQRLTGTNIYSALISCNTIYKWAIYITSFRPITAVTYSRVHSDRMGHDQDMRSMAVLSYRGARPKDFLCKKI